MTSDSAHNLAAATVLKNSAWFRGLSDQSVADIAALSVNRVFRAGESIFQHGEPGDYLYGVVSGSVRISVQSADGRELALNTLGPGDIGGEIALLDGGPRTATGRAIEDTTVFVVPRDQFTQLLLKQPEIALYLIRILCERVRHTSRHIEDAAFKPLAERLAMQIAELIQANERGRLVHPPYTIKISQSELASFLNVSRQVVNGCLQGWQKAGHIKLARGSITVHDLQGLLLDGSRGE